MVPPPGAKDALKRAEKQLRLVLCFDGTWNTWHSNTNVARFFSLVSDRAMQCPHQRKFYDEGVGTRWRDRIKGGLFGLGIDENIRQGYAWLAAEYPPDAAPAEIPPPKEGVKPQDLDPEKTHVDGAALYFLGFSRGAFTARSLVGLVYYLGIPKELPADEVASKRPLSEHPWVLEAWKLYAERPHVKDREKADAAEKKKFADHDATVAQFRWRCHYPVRVHFVGVWDTVGALGIPRIFNVDLPFYPLRPSTKYGFHNANFCPNVRFGYHAVAIDEHRAPYQATLWTAWDRIQNKEVEQRWFVGAHANVGGGYPHDLLPAPPLKWLADRAALCGLDFVNDRSERDAQGHLLPHCNRAPANFDLDGTEFRAPVRDSYAEFIGGAYRVVRSIPFIGGGRAHRRMLVHEDGIFQTVDATAFAKWQLDLNYRPPNLGQAGRTDVDYSQAAEAMPEAADQAAVMRTAASEPVTRYLPPKDKTGG